MSLSPSAPAGSPSEAEGDAPPVPEPAALRAALQELEPYATHPDTGAIHDPMYELLQDPDPAHARALHQALRRLRDHPAAARIRQALGPDYALPPRTLEDVLSEQGAWTHADPVYEVEHRLRSAARVRTVLEERLARQLDDNDRMARTANALAMVGALLAIFALVGWAGALGLWTIDWFEPPEPPADVVGPEPRP